MFNFDANGVEDKTFICFPAGEYEAEIVDIKATVSKAGNDMLKLDIDCFSNGGKKVRVFDYIVVPSSLYKLKAICKFTGIEFDGAVEEQILKGKRLMVKLKIEPEGDYPARNSIAAYVDSVDQQQPAPSAAMKPVEPVADDIPF
jgi:hypothetical protein